jgi:hypothetical protein
MRTIYIKTQKSIHKSLRLIRKTNPKNQYPKARLIKKNMTKTYKKKKKNPEINTQKLKINLKNKSQKSVTKSSRDLREINQKKKKKNPKINTKNTSRSRRLREK